MVGKKKKKDISDELKWKLLNIYQLNCYENVKFCGNVALDLSQKSLTLMKSSKYLNASYNSTVSAQKMTYIRQIN